MTETEKEALDRAAVSLRKRRTIVARKRELLSEAQEVSRQLTEVNHTIRGCLVDLPRAQYQQIYIAEIIGMLDFLLGRCLEESMEIRPGIREELSDGIGEVMRELRTLKEELGSVEE